MLRQSKEGLSSSIFVFAFFSASNMTLANYNIVTTRKINLNSNLPQGNDFAAMQAKDLQNRLGLTDEQALQIASILTEYLNKALNNNQDNSSTYILNAPQQTANDRIVSLLDKSQKVAFAQIQKDWWANINQDIGTINIKH